MTDNPTARQSGPIGVFDSGLGGLTILDGIRKRMPHRAHSDYRRFLYLHPR